jgi:hypothetical protein
MGKITSLDKPRRARINPVKVDRVENKEILNFVNSRRMFIHLTMVSNLLKATGCQGEGYFNSFI